MDKLLEQKPELTKEGIEEQINQKKEKIGAGYLTDQGALFLIASDYGITLSEPLKIEMELNSLEAIKNAVQSGLGASFLPVVSIERELAGGSIHKPLVTDLEVKRELKLITNPSRYTSKASEAFKKYILPQFASSESPLRQINQT